MNCNILVGPVASSLRVPQLLSAQIVSYSSVSNPKVTWDGQTYTLPALPCKEQLTQHCGTVTLTKKAYIDFSEFVKGLK